MQIKSTIFLALLPFITPSLAQDDKENTSAATSAVAPAVSSYLAHLTEKPQYSSVAAVVSTAVSGTKGQSRILNGDLSKVTTRSWYDGLPNDVKVYASSVASEKSKLDSNSGSAAATVAAPSTSATGAPKSAGTVAPIPTPSSTPSPPKGTTSAAAASQSATKNGAAETQVRGVMGMGVGFAGLLGVLVL